MPATENLTLKAGDDKVLSFTIDPSDLDDLDGATIRWWLARSAFSDPADADLKKDNISGGAGGIEIVSPTSSRKFNVELARSETLDFIGAYYHEAQVTDPDGNWATVTTGTITFERTLIRES